MNPPTDTPQVLPVNELALIGVVLLFFALWGWRHGLDAIIIAGLIAMVVRATVDALLVPVIGSIINMFYGIFFIMTTGRFSPTNLFAAIAGDPNVVKPLINVRDPNDPAYVLMGTILFALLTYLGFRFANKQAGGKDTPIEQIFGAIGGAALGYVCVTFVIDRHVTFPQPIVIEPSVMPQISLDAPLIVVIIMVLIVFGIQRSKRPAKKK